ncbi:MAG: ABC transporter permease [Rhodospirillaceae bacterium]|nr:ABC transporter permease [Rhodospirillaceae bacterium]
MEEQSCWLRTSVEGQSLTVTGGGDWTVQNLAYLDPLLGGLEFDNFSHVTMDVAGLTALDTAGAHIIHRLMNELDRVGIEAVLSGLAVAYRPLLEIVAEADDQPHEPLHEESHFILAMFERVGRALIDALIEAKSLVNFFGLTIIAFGSAIAKPRRLRPIALINQIEQTGFNAVLIVCLLNFLIGIVIAYQGAVQLRQFGAEIFMIDGLAFGIPREIAVLITAIVVAGRSGSAFTAQIGTMQVNQEVDALKVVGLDPIEVLVLPRINALLITLPMLVFLADVAGLMGGGLMAVLALDLTVGQFMNRLEDVISLQHFLVGLVKAPVFAYIIAIVGCFEGLRVTGSAESVGKMTTKSVVESIVLVILADALFSILFSALGI